MRTDQAALATRVAGSSTSTAKHARKIHKPGHPPRIDIEREVNIAVAAKKPVVQSASTRYREFRFKRQVGMERGTARTKANIKSSKRTAMGPLRPESS